MKMKYVSAFNRKEETVEWEVLKNISQSLTFEELQLLLLQCETLQERDGSADERG